MDYKRLSYSLTSIIKMFWCTENCTWMKFKINNLPYSIVEFPLAVCPYLRQVYQNLDTETVTICNNALYNKEYFFPSMKFYFVEFRILSLYSNIM